MLRWPFISEGARGDAAVGGQGTGGTDPTEWLIFGTGRSELGVHPTSDEFEGKAWSEPRHHAITLMCDDVEATVADLAERGAEFHGPIQDMGFGRGIMLQVPGADDMLLYEARHATAYDLS